MAAEIERLAQAIRDQGWNVGGKLLSDFGRTLMESGLIGNTLGQAYDFDTPVSPDVSDEFKQEFLDAPETSLFYVKGSIIKDKRLLSRMSLVELGEGASIDISTLSRIENGKVKKTHKRRIIGISQVLSCNVFEIIDESPSTTT